MALAMSSCPYPTRGTRDSANGRRKWDESDWAEQVAFLRFVEDFKDRHKGGVFFSQRDYLTQTYPSDGNTTTLLQMMSAYFRNWVPPAAFRQNPSTRKEGGPRKPDGLGISPVKPDGTIVVELLEVKPADSAADGRAQLTDQISKLQDGMKGYLDELRTIETLDPGIREDRYQFVRSPFIPKPQHLTFPLFNLSDASPAELSWVCYRPTLRLRKPLGEFSLPNPDNDGLILYEIHDVNLRRSVQSFQRLPKSLREAIARAFAAAQQANRVGAPTLLPWATNDGRAARAALRDQLVIAGAIVVVGLILLCVFQPELAPGAVAAGEGLADAAAASTAADEALASNMVETVFQGYRVPTLFRVGTSTFATHDAALEFALDVVEETQGVNSL